MLDYHDPNQRPVDGLVPTIKKLSLPRGIRKAEDVINKYTGKETNGVTSRTLLVPFFLARAFEKAVDDLLRQSESRRGNAPTNIIGGVGQEQVRGRFSSVHRILWHSTNRIKPESSLPTEESLDMMFGKRRTLPKRSTLVRPIDDPHYVPILKVDYDTCGDRLDVSLVEHIGEEMDDRKDILRVLDRMGARQTHNPNAGNQLIWEPDDQWTSLRDQNERETDIRPELLVDTGDEDSAMHLVAEPRLMHRPCEISFSDLIQRFHDMLTRKAA